MSNIYLRLQGGLGNQLYQFSYAYAIFKKNNFSKIIIDKSGMNSHKENWGDMLYLLLDKKKISKYTFFYSHILHFARIAKMLPLLFRNSYRIGFVSDKNSRKALQASFEKNLYLDGYFETVSDLINYKDILKPILIKEVFIPKQSENILVVNIRGGVYSFRGEDFVRSQRYYLKLLENLDKKIKVHLVTDDIEYSMKILKDIEVYKVHTPDPFENFRFIISSRRKILAHSTFSTWAGILSDETDDIYYHPEIVERKWK